MNAVYDAIDRPSATLVEQMREIPTPVLADTQLEAVDVMDSGIKPVYPDAAFAGTAITVDCQPGDNLMIHKAVTMAKEGDVLVVDTAGYPEAGVWGELLSMSALEHGLTGTVVDGGVRDISEITELEYPVFTRSVSPKGTTKRQPGSINVPVVCGGSTVSPSDLIVGDADGVAVINSGSVERARKAALAKVEKERSLQERISDGEYIYDVADLDAAYRRLDIDEAD